MSILINLFGEIHCETSNSIVGLGNIYLQLQNFDKAIEFYKRALNIRYQIFKQINQNETSEIYCLIGFVYGHKQDYKNAIVNHKICLDIRIKLLGENHSDPVALAYRNIAINEIQLNENIKSLNFLKKALDIKTKIYGHNHFEVAQIWQDIGFYYENFNLPIKSIKSYKKSLEILEKIKNNQEAGLLYIKLAILHLKKKNKSCFRAINCLEKSILKIEINQ